ncbi:hypothetical protein D1007_15503 [Hordeum vulgare]|nr:hypothetical protein D1007_15503 [Hordeum vulgare]
MDPSFKDYFDMLTNSINAIHTGLRSNTMAIDSTVAKLDEMVHSHPDLECRVEQLSSAVAELQQGRLTPSEKEHVGKMSDLPSDFTAEIIDKPRLP